MNGLTKEEAIEKIKTTIQVLTPESPINENFLQFWIEKLVSDILDYCHREDFPPALVYTCVDLILKRISDYETENADGIDSDTGLINLNGVSEIKMDDTSFKFSDSAQKATTTANNVGLLADLDFDSIKSKLNLYRLVVSA